MPGWEGTDTESYYPGTVGMPEAQCRRNPAAAETEGAGRARTGKITEYMGYKHT